MSIKSKITCQRCIMRNEFGEQCILLATCKLGCELFCAEHSVLWGGYFNEFEKKCIDPMITIPNPNLQAIQLRKRCLRCIAENEAGEQCILSSDCYMGCQQYCIQHTNIYQGYYNPYDLKCKPPQFPECQSFNSKRRPFPCIEERAGFNTIFWSKEDYDLLEDNSISEHERQQQVKNINQEWEPYPLKKLGKKFNKISINEKQNQTRNFLKNERINNINNINNDDDLDASQENLYLDTSQENLNLL